MFFKKDKPAITISEVELQKQYPFMYENFIFSSQHKIFLILAKTDDYIEALEFDFLVYKYGYPNDEANHPFNKYGLGFYGLYKVNNSPWIAEIINNNRQHPRHSDDMFADCEHYIAKFKDVTLEVVCRKMEQVQITKALFLQFVEEQIKFVEV